MKRLEILSIGGFSGLGTSNTCLQRNRILEEFGNVDIVDTTAKPYNLHYRFRNKLFQWGFPVSLPDLQGSNEEICNKVKNKKYDLIWIDKGIIIKSSTFQSIKECQPNAKLVGYSPDYMCYRHNQTKQFLESLPFYDVYVTTKSYAVPELKEMGCKNVYFVGNAYQDGFHKPYQLTAEEHARFDCKVGFIGAWEQERSDSICFLANNGVRIKVWGSKEWEQIAQAYPNIEFAGRELLDESYCKAICGCEISLCFLRKKNLDLQTTRSIEIPACGSMMIAERTTEHRHLFNEDEEAVFFGSNDELLAKVRYYAEHENERKAIALAGYNRCISSGYSNKGRIKEIIEYVFK